MKKNRLFAGLCSVCLAGIVSLSGCGGPENSAPVEKDVVSVSDAAKTITLDINDLDNDSKNLRVSYYILENGVENVTYDVSTQSDNIALSEVVDGRFTVYAESVGTAKVEITAKVGTEEKVNVELTVDVKDSASDYVPSEADAENIWAPNAGNPVLPGYIGDPYLFVDDDGTAYIYGTTDAYGSSGGDLASGPYCVWYSKDFVNWECKTFHYGKSFPKSTSRLWAPSVTKVGSKYYMAYIWNGYNCYLAESKSPLGPWVDVNNGNALTNDMFDSDIVTFDSGTYIVTMGPQKDNKRTVSIGKMKDDMSGLEEVNGSLLTPIYNENVFEAPGIFERDGIWYLTFSNGSLGDGSYHVEYATADNIYGPYTYQGYVIQRDDEIGMNTTGHSNVEEIDGEYYLCYHYKTKAGDYARIAGLEKLEFNEDGTIKEVKPTVNGSRPDRELTIKEENLAFGARVEASSVGQNASLGTQRWLPQYAVDSNNGTLWQAGSLDEQYFTVDLGKVMKVGRVETFFEFHTLPYRYVMEYSADKETWIQMGDRSKNMNDVAPMVDSTGEIVEARYIRIKFPEGGINVGRDIPVGIFEMKVYRTPAQASSNVPEGGILGDELVTCGTFEDWQMSYWNYNNLKYSWDDGQGSGDYTTCTQNEAGVGGTAYQTITIPETGYYRLSAYIGKNYQNVDGGEGYVAVIGDDGKVLKLQLNDQNGEANESACTEYVYTIGEIPAGTYKLVVQLDGVNLSRIDSISLRLVGFYESDIEDLLSGSIQAGEDIRDLPLKGETPDHEPEPEPEPEGKTELVVNGTFNNSEEGKAAWTMDTDNPDNFKCDWSNLSNGDTYSLVQRYGSGKASQTITVTQAGNYCLSAYISKSYNVNDGYIVVKTADGMEKLKISFRDMEGDWTEETPTELLTAEGYLGNGRIHIGNLYVQQQCCPFG